MNSLAGTGELVRVALRRDRVMMPGWIAVFVLSAASAASATIGLYPTVESRIQAAAGSNHTTAIVALYGRVYDPTSIGSLSMLKLSAMGAVLVAVLAMLTVVRHTRAEEEAGRLQLVGAAVVGRRAPLTAALALTVGMSLVLGLLTSLGVILAGLPGPGALAFGLSWAAVGVVFAAVAAVAAQLTRSARTANGICVTALAGAYLVRAIGDASGKDDSTWLSWLSPIGWGQQVRPFAGERWWVLALLAAFAAVVAGGAYWLVGRRDVGAGLLPERAGPATAARWLNSPLALAWRLHRGVLAAWLAGFVVLGVVLGSIASAVEGMLDSPQAREMILKLGGVAGLADAFLSTDLGIMAVVVTVYGVQVLTHLRTEETSMRAEPVLATAVGRGAWAGGHLAVALAGTTVLVVGTGLAAGVAHSVQVDDVAQLGRVLGGALVYLPAVWVVIGIATALFGALPRLMAVGWVLLVAFLLLGEFGPLLQLPSGVMRISPYAHVPRLPGGDFAAWPLVWLVAVAAALMAFGLAAFRRRDIG